jgi:glutaredoxin
MKIKIFTQPSCPKCPAAKAVVKQVEDKFQVEHHDIQTEDGLAEALSYDVMATPSIIVLNLDNEVVSSWHGETPKLEDLNKLLKS